MYLALQSDRCASSNCLKTLAEEMIAKSMLNTEQLQLMLKSQEQSARALARV